MNWLRLNVKQVLKQAAVVMIVLVALSVVISRMTGADPSLFGYQFKNVLSGSMEPVFMTGSVIQIKKTTAEGTEYETGDVITFHRDNMLITHRIIEKITNDQTVIYRTQGDNNDGPDIDPVSSDAIVGKYTGLTIPYIGYPLGFANSKIGALILLLIPGVIFLVIGIGQVRGVQLGRE
ncbi:signal peptidase I SipW [Jeotgalibacillus salarius]|uniref:Signal peptidase I n=1 Tax=Jeotgalibacillus salarius TaxID=546023 RepID=A0A4Y8LST1_9BACL|nr:signal peptidase I [Jeotgalibacillus salarius]TFE04015.1 signal peptidase I [Jeotgalibacillus salarius]